MRITYRLVDQNNYLLSAIKIPPLVTIPASVIGVKLKPGRTTGPTNKRTDDELEMTIEVNIEAKWIYTNEDRKSGR